MHFLHLISVQAPNSEEALELVESALDPFGMGDVWDYYTVGGRWENYFGEGNALRYTDNPKRFIEELDRVLQSYNQRSSDSARSLIDSGVLEKLAEGHNLSDFAEFGPESMVIWEFCKRHSSRYNSHSGFYDYTSGEAGNPTRLMDRLSLDPGDQEWLVAVDLHN